MGQNKSKLISEVKNRQSLDPLGIHSFLISIKKQNSRIQHKTHRP